MSTGYHVFEWAVVLLVVGIAAWRVWRTYAPKPRTGGSEPGCDAGCPSCNHCEASSTPAAGTGGKPAEQPIRFHPRPR